MEYMRFCRYRSRAGFASRLPTYECWRGAGMMPFIRWARLGGVLCGETVGYASEIAES